MASLIHGYEYDIFISYRQRDNKGDRWVSEFVEALKTELESTFKEEISVYFDINPHDGLLETHDVDASLKDKLKCLVFIPIISRTYCDPKSFAWENEFKAFVEQASQDQFGLKVKLPGGNVASRVLPIRIYDLNIADIKLCETVLGGVLRGVEFIYSEPGVNRPLKPDDDEKINLNKTKYRNQINKIGNAIEEIISGLKTGPVELVIEKIQHREPFEEVKKEKRKEEQKKPANLPNRKLLTGGIVLAVLLVIATIFIYPKIFRRDTLEKLRSSGERISVAVMPFQNMTNDTTWDVWQDVIQNNLIISLSNYSGELLVRQSESIDDYIQSKGLSNYASITPSLASAISQKLKANVFIYGKLNKAGETMRLTAQLISSKTEEVIKPFKIEGPAKEEMIFQIIDSLSTQIKNFLVVSKLEEEVSKDFQQYAFTNSTEAYRYFNWGQKAYNKEDYPMAINMLSQAIAADSNFTFAITLLSLSYRAQGLYQEGKKWCRLAYAKRNMMPMQQKMFTNWVNAIINETPFEELKYLMQLQLIDDQLPQTYFSFGRAYMRLNQYDKAIPPMEKSLEIYKKQGLKPRWALNYTHLGASYHETRQYKKEKKLYKRAERDFPNDFHVIYRQAILSLIEKDTVAANRYIERYVSTRKDQSWSEASIMTTLAQMFSEASILNKAEGYYRKAFYSEPENPERINNLAYFLIDKERNVNEGMEHADKALELSPDNYGYLHTKGWGLYKQGKYKEALDMLQKSWNLRMKNAIYDHEALLHLEAAKKAVASQKNN